MIKATLFFFKSKDKLRNFKQIMMKKKNTPFKLNYLMKTKLNLDEIQEFPLMITKPECLINFKLVKEIKANKIPDFQHQLCRSH